MVKERRDTTAGGEFFSVLSMKKFRPCFTHLLLLVPAIKTTEIIHKERSAAWMSIAVTKIGFDAILWRLASRAAELLKEERDFSIAR